MNLQEQVSRIKQVMKLNESEDNDLIFSLFDEFTKDADLYYNPENESIWMIFPKEKKWVFELEKSGALWFNYNFFHGIFKYLSLDVVENQHYITKWVEDTLKKVVRYTRIGFFQQMHTVEDTLKKVVRYTSMFRNPGVLNVEDTLKRGKKLNNDDELK